VSGAIGGMEWRALRVGHRQEMAASPHGHFVEHGRSKYVRMDGIGGHSRHVVVNAPRQLLRTQAPVDEPLLEPDRFERAGGDGAEHADDVRLTERGEPVLRP